MNMYIVALTDRLGSIVSYYRNEHQVLIEINDYSAGLILIDFPFDGSTPKTR